MKYQFITSPSIDDLIGLIPRINKDEILELAALGQDPEKLFRENIEVENMVGVYSDGVLLAAYGLARTNEPHVGIPWMLAVDAEYHARVLAKHTKQTIAKYLDICSVLYNVVGSWNKKSIAFLRYAGFTVEDEMPLELGKNGEIFYRFYILK